MQVRDRLVVETNSQDPPEAVVVVGLAALTEIMREAGRVEDPICQPNANDEGANTGAAGPSVAASYGADGVRQTGNPTPGPQKLIGTTLTGRSEFPTNLESSVPSKIAQLPGGIDRVVSP
jgi:hypothetical protein